MNWKYLLLFISIVVLLSSLLFDVFFSPSQQEGLDIIPIATDPSTSGLINGYYQVDDNNMAQVPYGYSVNGTNPRKLNPTIEVEINKLNPKITFPFPKPGEKMPDNYYLLTDSSLAILPPNMLPNLSSISFDMNGKVLYYYDTGYVSETEFYAKTFVPKSTPPAILPDDIYYADPDHKTISILKYGMKPDTDKKYGVVIDPSLNLDTTEFNYMTSNYRDVSNNFNIQFHDDVDTIVKQDNSSGDAVVRDQTGNLVVLQNKHILQDSVTYYQPGEFPFGASTYIPNYEDSVYLSSIGFRSFLGPPTGNTKSCGSMCKAYNDFKNSMDLQCNNSK